MQLSYLWNIFFFFQKIFVYSKNTVLYNWDFFKQEFLLFKIDEQFINDWTFFCIFCNIYRSCRDFIVLFCFFNRTYHFLLVCLDKWYTYNFLLISFSYIFFPIYWCRWNFIHCSLLLFNCYIIFCLCLDNIWALLTRE